MALKTIVCTLALIQLSSMLAVRVDLEEALQADLRNSNIEDGKANLSLGPDSEECKACLQPCEEMEASDADTIEAFKERIAKNRCLIKCVTGGSGMPVGPCRVPPGTVTVSDIFNDPRIITDRGQIFQPRANQVAWLKLLKGNGDSYVQRGGFAFALKQINFEDHVIVLMFKEQDQKVTQFFVDGPEYASHLLSQLTENPALFDAEQRPAGTGEAWRPVNPCDHENPAECCCYYQDRKFVTGYFYDQKHAGAGCNGQSIDNCGDDLNPMPGMVFFSQDKATGLFTMQPSTD